MNELLQAAKRLYDAAEAIKSGHLALCQEVAADANAGVLRVFGVDERPVGVTVDEAGAILKARDEFAALWQQIKQQQQAKPQADVSATASPSRLDS